MVNSFNSFGIRYGHDDAEVKPYVDRKRRDRLETAKNGTIWSIGGVICRQMPTFVFTVFIQLCLCCIIKSIKIFYQEELTNSFLLNNKPVYLLGFT